MFGCGAVAQVVLSEGSHGLFLTVNLAFGFAATLGILVCGQVSGRQTPLKLHLKLMLCVAIKTGPSFYKRFFVDELVGWKNFFFIFRRTFKSSSYIFSLPLGTRKVEKVSCVLSVPNAWILLGCRNYLCWIPWYMLHSINVLFWQKCILCFSFLTFFKNFILDAMYDYAGESNELIVMGPKATAGIFATYPSPHLTILNGFFDQVSNCKLTSL